MILIVEGPRGSGKSTLCGQLAAFKIPGMQMELCKFDRTDDPHGHMSDEFTKQGADRSTIYIWDRALVTEYIMSLHTGRRLANEVMMSTAALFALLYASHSLILHISIDSKELERRFNGRNDGREFDMDTFEDAAAMWAVAGLAFRQAYPHYVLVDANWTRFDVHALVRAHVDKYWKEPINGTI